LAFEQERLEDIAKVLERMYNVQIKFASENLKNVRFSGKVKNNNLESILQLIAFVSPIYYSMDNDSTVTIHESRPRNRHASQKYTPIGKLPCVTERFDLTKVDEKDSGPSCSLAEAIDRQDLFINSTLANIGSKLLWKLFREGRTDQAGVFLNMDTLKMNPIRL
jgi:hypothetical protein